MAATAQPLEADRFSLLGRKRPACGTSRPKLLASPALQSCKREWVEVPAPPRPSPSPSSCAPPRRAGAPQTQGVIRVVHIFAPKVIKTDVDNFRAVVQRLTGHHCHKPGSLASSVDAPAAKRAKLEMAHVTHDHGTTSCPSQSHQADKSSTTCATSTAAAGVSTAAHDSSPAASAAATDPVREHYRFPAFQGNHIACRPLPELEILDMDAPIAQGGVLCCATYPPSSFHAHHGQQHGQQQQLEHQDSLASSANSNSGSMHHVCDSGGAPPLLLPTNLFSSCAVAASQQQQQQYYSNSSSSSFLAMGGGFHPALALGAGSASGLGLQGLLMGAADCGSLNWVQEAAINMIADAVHIRSSGMHMGLPPLSFPDLELSDTDFLADLWGSLQQPPAAAACAMPLPHDHLLAMHMAAPMDSYEFAVASQLCRAAQP